MSERSSGDGGSDGDTGHYATVGRRVRGEAIYSSMRRPGGESDYDPYASIRIRRGQEETNYESLGGEDQLYETLSKQENEKSISSEASSVSQATVMQASMQPSQADMVDLYARVDMNKKRNRNSDSSLSPMSEAMKEVNYEAELKMSEPPVAAPRSLLGVRERQEEAVDT